MKNLVLGSAMAAGVLFSGFTATSHADDRRPDAAERQAIENTLRSAGYTSWEEIEFDDGVWEVDDARKGSDRTDYDIKIDPRSWQIISARPD